MPDIAGAHISYKIDINGLGELAGMQKVIKQIDQLFPKLSKSAQDAKQSINQMNREASNSRVSDNLAKDKRGFDNLTGSAKKTGEEVHRTAEQTSRLGQNMQRSMNKPYFKKQTRDLKELGSKMQSFGAKASVATAGIAAGAAVAIKAASTLQNRYKVITNLAVTGGEKQAEAVKNVAAMQKDGTKYSTEYGIAQKNIGEGYETLIRRGYTTNQALGSQKSYLQGAIASGDSYSDVVNNAASAIEQFGMKVNSVKGMAAASKTAINQMAYSADLTATSFGNLGEALKYSGPDAHAAHQSLHTTVAAIGDISNFGIDGSQAGTSMRQIYQRLVSPPAKGKAPNAMAKLGMKYSDFRDSKKELLPIQQIFGKLATKMNQMKMSKTDKGAIYAALFGVNASSAAQALGSSYKQVDALDKKVQKSQNMYHGKGYVAQLSEKNLNTLQKQWNRIKTGLMASGINIANAWMPSLTKIAHAVADILDGFNKLPTPTRKFISLGIGAAAVVGPLALVAGSLLKIKGALNAITKLSGETKKPSFLGDTLDFMGIGGRKNNPKTFAKRVEGTHFSKQAKVPGSWLLNSGKANRSRFKELGSLMGDGRNLFKSTLLGRGLTRINAKPKQLAKAAIEKTVGFSKHAARSSWEFAKSTSGKAKAKTISAARKVPEFFGKSKLGRVVNFAGKHTGGLIGKTSKLGFKTAKFAAKNIPGLDILTAGLGMIGTTKNNAGKKTGSTAGMLAGGAVGSLLGPLGSMAGAAIGQMLGSKLGKTLDKTMPKNVKKSLGKVLKSIGTTFNHLMKPFKGTIKSIKRVWDQATKGIGKVWTKYVSKPLSGKNGGKKLVAVFKALKAIMIPVLKVGGAAFKVFGAVVKTAIKVVADVIEGLIKTVSNVFSLISDLIHGRWKKAWNDALSIFSNIFGTIGNVLGDILKTVWDGIVDLGKKIGQFLMHPVKTIKSWFSDGSSSSKGEKTPKSIKGLNKQNNSVAPKPKSNPKIKVQTGLSHAAGGPISHNQLAMVNEAGTELAYRPNSGRFRLLGNGPALAQVKAGEHIINAKDTLKLFNGGLGNGKVLPGYAAGTAKLTFKKNSHRSASLGFDSYGSSTKTSLKSLTKLQKGSKRKWIAMHRDTAGSTKLISKDTHREFTGIYKDTDKQTDLTRKNAVKNFDDMQKGTLVQMNQMHKGMNAVTQAMVTDFNKIFSKLSAYAHSAMAAAIKQLNGGIKGIDTTFAQFGGNTQVLKPIQYAKGSNGKLPTDQIAMLNDATSGPVQEGLVDPQGNVSAVHGRNSIHYLKKGSQVLNGSQFKNFLSRGGVARYAKGSGVSDSTLEKLVERSQKNVSGSWQAAFKDRITPAGSKLSSGIANSGRSGAGKVGIPWITAAWDVLSNLIGAGGGSRKKFLEYAKQHFTGKRYVMGGLGPTVYDCSGMVSTALKHFGINAGRTTTAMQGSSALERLGKSYHLGQPGDLYLFGHGNGAAGHVGILKNPRTGSMFNETPPRARVTSINDVTSVSHDGVYRVKGLKDEDDAHTVKADPRLKKLFRQQLGKRAINKLQTRFADSTVGSGPAPTGDHMHWLEQAGIPKSWWSATSEIISKESGWNPKAANSSGAYGLPQALPGSKMASAGSDWKTNPITQLKWYKSYIKNRYGTIGKALSFRHAHNWYANGGWAQNGHVNVFGEAKGENEVAINTHRPSADHLLLEAMSDRALKAPDSIFGRLRVFAKMQREFAKMKASQIRFSETTSASPKPSHNAIIRPQITYSPQITVNGSSDPEKTKKMISKEMTADRRKFESFINDLCARSIAAG